MNAKLRFYPVIDSTCVQGGRRRGGMGRRGIHRNLLAGHRLRVYRHRYMPGARDPNKSLASFWMNKDIHSALGIVAKISDTTVTRYILEALADKMGFTLDGAGNPVGLNLESLARDAYEKQKRPLRKKKAE